MADSIVEQPGVSHDEGKLHRGDPGKDSVYSWVLLGCASFSLSVIVGLMMGCSSMFFVELLEEFGESKEKTGEEIKNAAYLVIRLKDTTEC